MKRLADKTAVIFVLCLLLGTPLRAADLLAHANDQTLWIGQIKLVPALHTSIRYRALGGELQWREMPRLTGRALNLASRGPQLAVLMESGEWLLGSPSGYSTGPALPDAAKMIALAGESNALFAIGLTGGARTTSTAPATTATSTLEAAATAQASVTTAPAQQLVLYEFDGATWTALADLPDDIVSGADIALAVINERPMIAVVAPQQSIHVIELTAQKTWSDRGTISVSFSPRQFELLAIAQRPLLWIAGQNDAGVISTGGERWSASKKLELDRPIVSARGRAFVFAAGNLRLYVENDADGIYEQCYRTDGQRNGKIELLASPRPVSGPGYNNWSTLAVLAIVLFVMFGSARRRSSEEETKIDGLPLAPPSLRLLAGLIDLLPIILTMVTLQMRLNITDPSELPPIPILIATGVYLLHTLIGELVMGRSIGKAISGLRVIMVDGKKPGAGAIVVRNAMRLIDIFPPLLVVILFTPLRQRMGDVIAGTTVVLAAPEPESNKESDEQE